METNQEKMWVSCSGSLCIQENCGVALEVLYALLKQAGDRAQFGF